MRIEERNTSQDTHIMDTVAALCAEHDADVARALSALDGDLAEVLVDYAVDCYAPDIVRTGIRSLDDLGRRLWQGDDKMFGDSGYSQVSLLIVRAVLGCFRHGFDETLDLDDELYLLLKQHKLLRCVCIVCVWCVWCVLTDVWVHRESFVLREAEIRKVADLGQMWGKKRNFGVRIASASFDLSDIRDALHEAYGFGTRANSYLRIGAHVVEYDQ